MQRQQWQKIVLSGVLCGSAFMGSCSAAVDQTAGAPEASVAPQTSSAAKLVDTGATDTNTQKSTQVQKLPQRKTQLIKKATLGLSVQNLEKTIQAVNRIIEARQGDLLKLEDQIPRDETTNHTAILTVRVPQDQLDGTIAELLKLGIVVNRSVQVEDVSSQLVDFESRLRNLRKAEATVLKIMDRSGSVGDVLKVSQELSKIRESIEQIDGQVQNLKRQVAYSTINLTLEEAIAQTPQGRSLGNQLQESWVQATHSISVLTTHLMQLAVWLFVFSPYLIGIGLAIFLGRKTLIRKRLTPASPRIQSSEPSEL